MRPSAHLLRLCGALIIGTFAASCGDNSTSTPPPPGDMLDQPVDMVVDPTVCFDRDGDGAYAGESCPTATDCDDSSAGVNPGAQEVCGDNIDNNCDGQVDEGCPCTTGELKSCTSLAGVDALSLLREEIHCKPGVQRCMAGAWGECEGEVGPLDEEQCNGVDDNCDGRIDEGQRNLFGQCLSELPDGWMPPAEDCGPAGEGNGLDDDGDGEVDEGCSCAQADPSLERKGQVCYGGPPGTLGVGVCQGGKRDCTGGVWGTCAGQVLPSAEICGDALDNDCDGIIDNGCPVCVPSNGGVELCDGQDNDCDGIIDNGVRNACGGCGEVSPNEICGDGIDNNCNGLVDERCSCELSQQPCYAGAPEHAGVGACVRGVQQCTGEFYGLCLGSVLPVPEVCGDGVDNDCDGVVDNGCGCVEGSTRPCGTSTGACERGQQTCSAGVWGACEGGVAPTQEVCDDQDNDCDGLTNEGLINACGLCDEPCYTQAFDPTQVGDVDNNVDIVPANDPENPRNKPGISLSRTTSIPATVWVANSNTQTVSKLNSDTNEEEARYWVGINPSRTAVDLEGNMWVIGRDDGRVTKVWGNERDCEDRDMSGTIETSRRVNNAVSVINSAANPLLDECVAYSQVIDPARTSGRGVAVTPDGMVWFGYSISGQPAAVKGIEPNTFQLTPTYLSENMPRFDRNAQGGWTPNGIATARQVYGIIADSQGIIWMVDWDARELSKFNPQTRAWEAYYHVDDCDGYGIALDGQDRLWLGCWSGGKGGGVAMFDTRTLAYHRFMIPQAWINQNSTRPPAGAVSPVTMVQAEAAGGFAVSALSVEPATGDVWATLHNTGMLGRLKVNDANLAASQWVFLRPLLQANGDRIPEASGLDMRGLGFDRSGFAWHFGMQVEHAIKINPTTNTTELLVPMPGAGGHYMYSDFTGSTLFSFTAPRASWRHTFDAGFSNARVDTVTIEAHVPADTTLGMRIRPLSAAGAPLGDWIPAGAYAPYPTGAMQHTFDLSALGGPLDGDQFEIDLLFTTNDRDLRPIIYDIRLGWQRP